MEYNDEGNLIIHGPSYYAKEEKKKNKFIISEDEAKFRKLENSDGPKIDTKAIDFRKSVTKRRTELKMNQKDLAFKCGVKPEVIRDIENGNMKPENKLHQKLRRVLTM